MNGRLQRLRAEIANDRDALAGRIRELSTIDLARHDASEGDLARAALALHHAYGAVESALTRIARTVEGSVPDGAEWHQALLSSMTLDLEGVRPPVLGAETASVLRRLLAFRHFLRHAYTAPLERERLQSLRADAIALEGTLADDLDRFDAFLNALAGNQG